jgi:hypothetical protein
MKMDLAATTYAQRARLDLHSMQLASGLPGPKKTNDTPTQAPGLANEPARTLPASRPWCRWPAFASGVMPGLVLVPIDAGGTPLRSPAKTSLNSAAPRAHNAPIYFHFYRLKSTNISFWGCEVPGYFESCCLYGVCGLTSCCSLLQQDRAEEQRQ